jgi:hypothetical protein
MLLASTMLCSTSVAQTFVLDVINDVGAPISELPKSVSPSEGKATLVADFDTLRSGAISVYLINQTDEDLILNAQDGDVYLKLEAKTKDGTWTRAQPHEFSWCGNSYFVRPLIKKGHFYKIDGYQPRLGEKAVVRYRLYLQEELDLVILEGAGFVLEEDKRLSSIDKLAIRTGTLNFVESIALGERAVSKVQTQRKDPQTWAIHELGSGRFPPEQSRPILDRVETRFPDRKEQVAYARERLMQVRK